MNALKLHIILFITISILSGCGNREPITQNPDNTEVSIPEETGNSASQENFSTLSQMVDTIIRNVDAATPSSDHSENETTYFTLKESISEAERKLDLFEDVQESQYRDGIISFREYLKMEGNLENLDNKLEASEDQLERIFGTDD